MPHPRGAFVIFGEDRYERMHRFLQQLICTLLIAGVLPGCAGSLGTSQTSTANSADISRDDAILSLIVTAREEPARKKELAALLMSGHVFVIPDPNVKSFGLLFFDQPERAFIPVFSSREVFNQEAYGTGFEGTAVSIDARTFAMVLRGDEVVILNPGHRPAIEFRGSELKALAR